MWILYLGWILNIVSMVLLSYLDYKRGFDIELVEIIKFLIISSIPYLAFVITTWILIKDTNIVLIKGKK